MATPEPLEVMLVSRRVDAGALFAGLRAAVVDEVQAMRLSSQGPRWARLYRRCRYAGGG
jgi:ATP-dependent Lhr-like helicase